MKVNKNVLREIKRTNPQIYNKLNKEINLRQFESIENALLSYYMDVQSICTSAENLKINALLGQVYK